MAAGADMAQMPFIKNLASSDRVLRTDSLTALQTFLSTRPSLPLPSALKLWTGLHYALWMTDRPRPQQALASDLANLLLDLRPGCAATWVRAFWSVMSVQWPHIDALRLDKFLLLVRRAFAAQVRWCKGQGYIGEDVDGVLLALREVCFDVEEENKVALGLRLHVLDIWVDELEREQTLPTTSKGDTAPPEYDPTARAFVDKIGDMVESLRRAPPKAVKQRAEESYNDERLPWVEAGAGSDEDMAAGQNHHDEADGDEGWGGIDE